LQEDEDEQLLGNNPSKDNAASAPPHHEKPSVRKADKKPTKYKKNPNAPKRFRRYVTNYFGSCLLKAALTAILLLFYSSAFIIYSKEKHKELRLQLESMGIEENVSIVVFYRE
jgi:hypothetical protein